jgi:integrase
MRGSIIKRHARSCPCARHGMRSKCPHCRRCQCRSWAVVIDRGYVTQADGTRRRKQQWVTITGTRAEAEARRAEMLRDLRYGVLVTNNRLTVAEWLDQWLTKIAPSKRASTVKTYRCIIDKHITPAIGSLRLSALTPLDLESYYASMPTLSRASLQIHHALLGAALNAAVRAGLLMRNPAALVTGKPRRQVEADAIRAQCLTADEAKRLLAVAREQGSMWGAFYALAIDSGARRSELLALRWSDIDLEAGRVVIARQLIDHAEPTFGPTKTGRVRTVDLAPDTIALLAQHKREQAALKMRNRTVYRADLDLVFARTFNDGATSTTLGLPISPDMLARRFHKLREQAGLPASFTFHGLRHTSATLLLAAGVPAKVAAERLGHASIAMTIDTYSHLLPSMGAEAARRLGALLHG